MLSTGNVLVTGASGFIGSHIAHRLAAQGRNVVGVDCHLDLLYSSEEKRRRWKALDSLNLPNLKLIEFDLRKDDFEFLRDFQISSVFNLAALPGIMSDWTSASTYYDCNLMALNRLLEFCRTVPLASFIQASTSSVYGKSALGDELSALRPTSPYGVSKLAAEHILLAYKDWYGIPAKILRYFSVYGPFQRPDMAYSKIISAIRNGTEFELHGDGEQRRSNTFINDVVDATLLAEDAQVIGETINICGDEVISLNSAIKTIENLMGKKLNCSRSSARVGDQLHTSGVNLKAKALLKWSSKTSFRSGIEAQISAFETSLK